MSARTLLTNATVIDGTGRAPVRADVLIEGERIADVGPSAKFAALSDAARADLAGLTLLPGLMDLHVHLMLDGEADLFAGTSDRRAPGEETAGYLMAKMVRNAARTLAAGFTLVREAGAKAFLSVDLKRATQDRVVNGPRILAAQPIVMTGGHGHRLSAIEADGADEVRKAARLAIKNGVDVIKVMATGGVLTPGTEPGSPQLTVEEIRAASEEARRAGKRTMAHAQGAAGIRAAIEGGIECIDHGQLMGTDDAVLRLAAERGVAYVPTLCNNPQKLAAAERARAAGEPFAIAPSVMRKARELVAPHRDTFEKAVSLGILVGCGTDAGGAYNFHGDNAQELEFMVRYGSSPLDAIAAATSRAARIVGLERELGSVEPGKLADLVVLDGDPLADIRVLRAPGAIKDVYVGGRRVAGSRAV